VSKYKIKKKKIKKPEPEKAPILAPPPPSDIPAMYAYKPEEEHFGLFILNTLDSRTARLKQALKEAGSGDSTNVVIDLYSNEQVLVLVKNFPRSELAKSYLESVKSKEVFKDFKPEEYQTYVISAKNYKKMLAERNPDPYRSFYNAYYKQN
jgi:bacillopeptidase F (M6 metalloprotease family)